MMNPIPLAMAFDPLSPLYTAFGWIMQQLYAVTGNFGMVIILFTLILRGLMIPLGIKQQKSTLKQQALQSEVAEIQRAFPNDKARQQQEQMALYKRHGASPLSGCLPSLLQLVIIWPIFRIIQAPMRHVLHVTVENLKALGELLFGLKNAAGATLIAEAAKNAAADNNIPLINALNSHAQAMANAVQQGLIKLDDLINLDFLGLNLGLTPSWRPNIVFGADTWRQYAPLLLIPVLVLASTLVQMRVMKRMMPGRKQREEAKAREAVNPARKGQTPEDKSESMMKTMNFIMPVFMLFTTFSMPASMGLYWIVGNLMSILQSFIVYYLFTVKKPDDAVALPDTTRPDAARG